MGKDDPPPYTPYAVPPPSGFTPQPGYPTQPPPSGYPPPTNVVVTQITPMNLGPEPVTMICPSCRHSIRTTVISKPTSKTHLFALLCCLFLCWPCFWVPYCMDSCRGHSHTCPNCGAFIGMYEG